MAQFRWSVISSDQTSPLFNASLSKHREPSICLATYELGKTCGHDHFDVRSRFPEPRFEIISVRTAREIGPACLFRFQSFEMSAGNHRCRRSYMETHFRIGRRERGLDFLDSRSIELAMHFTTASLRNTLCRSGYVHRRSSKIPHHG